MATPVANREQDGYRMLQMIAMDDAGEVGRMSPREMSPREIPRMPIGDRNEASAPGIDRGSSELSQRSCCPWLVKCLDTESDQFNLVIGCIIGVNAIVIGLETDLPHCVLFTVLDNVFNLSFVLEICLRLNQLGLKYFKVAWNIFDLTLVITGCLDLWIMPILSAKGEIDGAKHLKLMRLLRVLRVLRVLRIFRMFREMSLIISGFLNAIIDVGWIAVLVAVMDYIIAIFLTQMIGYNADEWEDDDAAMVTYWFGSIWRSMLTLFLIMTLDEWNQICKVTMKQYPLVVFFFVLYILIASYAMVSLITGVISDTLITATREDEVHKIRAFEARRREMTRALQEMFVELDIDASQSISRAEISNAMQHPKVLAKLKSLDVDCSSSDELQELFDSLSKAHGTWSEKDGALNIPIEEFVSALTVLHGTASGKKTFLLHQDVIALGKKVEQNKVRQEEFMETTSQRQVQLMEVIHQVAANVQELSAKVDKIAHSVSAG